MDWLGKIRAHHEKWADLPLMPTPKGMLTTKYDGELQELRDLADLVMEAVELMGFFDPKHLPWNLARHDTDTETPVSWPADDIPTELASWKARLETDRAWIDWWLNTRQEAA